MRTSSRRRKEVLFEGTDPMVIHAYKGVIACGTDPYMDGKQYGTCGLCGGVLYHDLRIPDHITKICLWCALEAHRKDIEEDEYSK